VGLGGLPEREGASDHRPDRSRAQQLDPRSRQPRHACWIRPPEHPEAEREHRDVAAAKLVEARYLRRPARAGSQQEHPGQGAERLEEPAEHVATDRLHHDVDVRHLVVVGDRHVGAVLERESALLLG
jgi:hypothetical protein